MQTAETGAPEQEGVLIHESRLILFNGALTARTQGQRVDGFDDSILQGVHDALRQTATAWQSVAHLISDASQGVLKISGLVDLIAMNGQEALRTRISMMDLARSVCRAILVDAEAESFERIATSFAGLPEMMDRMMMREAAAAEMPVTLLFGRAPAGLNATGDADIRGWYDTVADAQADELKPNIERLLRIMMSAKNAPTRGKVPDRWSIKFQPLWQPTDLELATVLKMKADTHVALVTAAIEMEAEAGLALAADIPQIDAEHRRDLLAADLAEGRRPGETGPESDDDPADDKDEADDDEAA
jgi:phage-related protein (TIGR01555 family)